MRLPLKTCARLCPLQVSITPIRHPGSGRVANWVAVQRDVSKRKAAEAAMQMREQALRWAQRCSAGPGAAAWGAVRGSADIEASKSACTHPPPASTPRCCSNLNEGITICDPSQKDCPVVYCNDAFLRCNPALQQLRLHACILVAAAVAMLRCGQDPVLSVPCLLLLLPSNMPFPPSPLLTGSRATAGARSSGATAASCRAPRQTWPPCSAWPPLCTRCGPPLCREGRAGGPSRDRVLVAGMKQNGYT